MFVLDRNEKFYHNDPEHFLIIKSILFCKVCSLTTKQNIWKFLICQYHETYSPFMVSWPMIKVRSILTFLDFPYPYIFTLLGSFSFMLKLACAVIMIMNCSLPPVNEIAGRQCFLSCVSVCSFTGSPMQPLPRVDWTSLHSSPSVYSLPPLHRALAWTLSLLGHVSRYISPSPLLVTSSGQNWRSIQTCSPEDLTVHPCPHQC